MFQNLEEVRTAVRCWVDTYNRGWLVEKNGFLNPWQARAQWFSPKPQSPGRLKKNLCPENRVRYSNSLARFCFEMTNGAPQAHREKTIFSRRASQP